MELMNKDEVLQIARALTRMVKRVNLAAEKQEYNDAARLAEQIVDAFEILKPVYAYMPHPMWMEALMQAREELGGL